MKTKMILVSFALTLGALLCGCPHRSYGPELTEDAEIYELCFTPEGHGQTSGGMGLSFSGDMHYAFPQTIEIPAVYAVVFKCQHGKFVINGSRGEELYKRFSKGDLVTVKYCDVIQIDDNGNTHAVDLHFLDAVKKP